MRVQGANVLVKKINDKVAGSIFIPSFGNMGYCYCEVVAVGKGAYFMPKDELIPLQIKVGDRTLINQGVMEEYEIVKNSEKQTYYWVPSVECTMVLDDTEGI